MTPGSRPDPTELEGLKAGSLKPVYLLAGDNTWLRERFVEKLRDLAVPAEWRSMNADIVWADETSEASAVEIAGTPPFGSPRRLLLVRDVEIYRGADARGREDGRGRASRPRSRRRGGRKTAAAGTGAADEFHPLLDYVRAPSPTTVLALISEKWDVKRWQSDDLYEAVEESGAVVPCIRPAGDGLRSWLVGQASSLGISMDAAAAAELVDRVGDDPLPLYRELEKLASYAGGDQGGGRVTVEEVMTLTGELATPSIFHFLDVLFVERRRSRALSLLSKLLREMHPLHLHSMLVGQLRKIIALKGACEENLPPGIIAGRVKLPMHLVSQLRLIAQRTPYGRFAELLRLLAVAEARLKRGKDGRQVLEGLVLECCK